MVQISFQPQLRPALLEVSGCKDYREERNLFIRIDEILSRSGIEEEFIELSIQQKQPNFTKMTAAQCDFFYRGCLMALRSNIARLIKNLSHREFCKLLPDSTILRWFLGIERLVGIKAFAKSTSDRFSHWLDENSLQYLNQRLIEVLAQADHFHSLQLNLEEKLNFEDIYFDSTCLKADIRFPVDWVLLPAIERLTKGSQLPIKAVWGDRGLDSLINAKKLSKLEIYNGLCPKNVVQLETRLQEEPTLRVGLRRRAGTEARISILTANFMGDKPRAKGFEHREMMVGWAVFTHNLWVLARLPQSPPGELREAS